MTADRLRTWVVKAIVLALIALTFYLYFLIGALLWKHGPAEDSVPIALWTAATAASAALIAFLINSKSGAEGGSTGPLEVVTPPNEPLAVREAVASPTPLHRQPVGDLHKEKPA